MEGGGSVGGGAQPGEGALHTAVLTLKRGRRDVNEHEYALRQINLNVSIY